MTRKETLEKELLRLRNRNQEIEDEADLANRPKTAREKQEWDSNYYEQEDILMQLEALEPQRSTGRKAAPTIPEGQRDYRAQASVRHGLPTGSQWQQPGEYMQAVRQAGLSGGTVDPRLVANTLTTYSQEGVGEDGGFLVPPETRTDIWRRTEEEDGFLDLVYKVPVTSSAVSFPQDLGAPWSTDGPQVYFSSEAGRYEQSRVNLNTNTVRLSKMTCLLPITDELLEDYPMLDAYLAQVVPERFRWKLQHKILWGTGAGEPLGIMNSPALIEVTKEGGQSSKTIMTENVVKMWSRCYAARRRNAVWLINQDIEPQLFTMALPVGVGGQPAYMPPNGLSGSPYASLFGRPVIPFQGAATLGSKGDIALIDLSQYILCVKSGAFPRLDVSIHLWFDQGVQAFRYTARCAGQPWWNSALTPASGSTNTLSPYVTLQARS